MAIYLTNSQISKVYFASSDVKAICLQNDSNRIYPINVIIKHNLTGVGSTTHNFTVPTGYDKCLVRCVFPVGMGNYSVQVDNNGEEVFEGQTMSGVIESSIFTVSEGTLTVYVTDSIMMDGYELTVFLYPAQEVTPDTPQPLQPITIDIEASGAFSNVRDIPNGYATLSYGITVDGYVESFMITYNGTNIVEEYDFTGYISSSVPLNGIGGSLGIYISTLDSSVMISGTVNILL